VTVRGIEPVPSAGGRPPPEPLMARYRPEDLRVFTPEELERYLAPLHVGNPFEAASDPARWRRMREVLAWELLYRVEASLYERLTSGERLHPSIARWFPARLGQVVEVAPGSGRLTVELAPRASRLIAVEPAAALRSMLAARLAELGLAETVEIRDGFFDELPVADGWADVVTACSAFSVDPAHGGDGGLGEMERVCQGGGLVVIVWPDDPAWLSERGYAHVTFDGPMAVEFADADEAARLCRIFYPEAAETVAAAGSRSVPYEVLGVNAPRDLCWKRVER